MESKGLVAIKPESHFATKWNFSKTRFKTVFGKKVWKNVKKKLKIFGFCFFAKLLSFEFSQKKFASDAENFSKTCSKTVLKSFLKVLQNRGKVSLTKALLAIRLKKVTSRRSGIFQKTVFRKLKKTITNPENRGRGFVDKALLPIRLESHSAARRNFFKNCFGEKEKKSQKSENHGGGFVDEGAFTYKTGKSLGDEVKLFQNSFQNRFWKKSLQKV